MRERYDWENKKDYDVLISTLQRLATRKYFKTKLLSALGDGYPIDFAPDYSPGLGISSNSPLLHLTLSSADYSYEETKLLLELGANVNATDAEGNNALIIAAMSSDSALLSNKEILLVKEILDKTQNVNHMNVKHETAFGHLCKGLLDIFGEAYFEVQKKNLVSLMRIFLNTGANPYLDHGWITDEDYRNFQPKGHNFIKNYIQAYYEQKDIMIIKNLSVYDYDL